MDRTGPKTQNLNIRCDVHASGFLDAWTSVDGCCGSGQRFQMQEEDLESRIQAYYFGLVSGNFRVERERDG